jgi:starch synthase
MAALATRRVAIFPWGDVIEEFLGPLGLTPEDFAGRMQGGWLFGYAAALQACGVEPVILYASESVARTTRLVHAETGAPIVLVPGRRTGGGRTAGRPSLQAAIQWTRTPFRQFARVLRREGCAAMLAQDYEHARFDALALLAKGLGLPLFATFQGGDLTLSPLERRVRRTSLRTCRGIAVASARERTRLAATYGLTSVVQDVPNPVDAEFWRAEPRTAARAALGIAPDELVFFNHGRIDIHRKGLDVLLAAWREVAPRRVARLVFLGSGQDREAFAARLKGVAGVTWISDYVTDPPLIRRWLSAADAYVTLSRTEGMPVAPLEAMACSLPVVASDAHGLADILSGGEASGGLLVAQERPDLAAQAMTRLADDPALRQRLGAAARARIQARYSTPAVGARLAAMFSEPRADDARHSRAARLALDMKPRGAAIRRL